jgi:MerR family transcriptional regulator, light-induced transcriptional regulator
MQQFTIRDIENLTGIKAHTLRIWEQRYQFFTPQRKASQHRFYDNDDLKSLLRISFLYNNGWKVSRIASLTQEDIIRQVSEAKVADDNVFVYVSSLIEAALDFDAVVFKKILNDVTEKIGFEKTIVEVCYPYLKKIGLLWSTNHVIPAQEHFSSYIIQNYIIAETDKLAALNKKPEIMLLCPEGEFHELPLLFINYMMKKNNWAPLYLGANITRKEMLELTSIKSIEYIYLHLITNFTGMHADDYLDSICRSFPDKKIVASGDGIRHLEKTHSNLQILHGDEQMYNFINRTTLAGRNF